jgi:DNA-binding transcriptional MerR regulator
MNEREIMNTVKLDKLTTALFIKRTEKYAWYFDNDLEMRGMFSLMAGSEANARAFMQTKGVSIGHFSQMVNLPISTVRHYVRLGLIEPWEVAGRYRFHVVNVIQTESVLQWCDLGLTLEEIVKRKRATQDRGILFKGFLEGRQAEGSAVDHSIGFIQRTIDGENISERVSFWTTTSGLHEPETWTDPPELERERRNLAQELLIEYRAAREKLEQKKIELERRIARALEFEQKLQKAA